jgi:hypothetical protein
LNERFFQLLYRDAEFCETLGRMMLAAAQLESALRTYLAAKGETVPEKRATLGVLTGRLVDTGLVTGNGHAILDMLGRQRNYFAHSLFDLFAERIEETLLPRTDLTAGDVSTFTDYAFVTTENLEGITDIVNKRLSELAADDVRQGAADVLF